jgi:hypothetical protein
MLGRFSKERGWLPRLDGRPGQWSGDVYMTNRRAARKLRAMRLSHPATPAEKELFNLKALATAKRAARVPERNHGP